jgi:hypothetical protein
LGCPLPRRTHSRRGTARPLHVPVVSGVPKPLGSMSGTGMRAPRRRLRGDAPHPPPDEPFARREPRFYRLVHPFRAAPKRREYGRRTPLDRATRAATDEPAIFLDTPQSATAMTPLRHSRRWGARREFPHQSSPVLKRVRHAQTPRHLSARRRRYQAVDPRYTEKSESLPACDPVPRRNPADRADLPLPVRIRYGDNTSTIDQEHQATRGGPRSSMR